MVSKIHPIKAKEAWQHENKKQRVKPAKLGVEQILRKSFKDTLKEYANNSSLDGVKQMCNPSINVFERLVWITVFIIALSTACYFLLYIWSDTLNKPLIVSMDTPTYPITEVDFPAVAICNINRISKKALKEFAKEIYPIVAKHREPLELVEKYILYWGSLLNFSYNESFTYHPIFRAMVNMYRDKSEEVVNVMKRLAPSCKDMLVKCSWAGETSDCKSMFTTRRTIRGHCCTFNFILDFNADGKPDRSTLKVKRQSESGYWFGLTIILDPMLEDYAYTINSMEGFEIFLFPPMTYPDPRAGRVIHRIVNPNMAVHFELQSMKQVATKEVRKYSAKTRMCYFQDENKEKFNNMYTYSSCIINCRIAAIYSLCKCAPYFAARFRSSEDKNICTIDDLRCLNKYKEKLNYLYPVGSTNTKGLEMEVQESLSCSDCLPDCEHIRYFTQSYEVALTPLEYPEKDFQSIFKHGLNLTNKSMVRFYYPVSDTILDRLDIVYYWFEILSNVGGFGGIVMGFSVISVMEIIYYFFIRFFQILYKNLKKDY